MALLPTSVDKEEMIEAFNRFKRSYKNSGFMSDLPQY
jgi:hypothetical protein